MKQTGVVVWDVVKTYAFTGRGGGEGYGLHAACLS